MKWETIQYECMSCTYKSGRKDTTKRHWDNQHNPEAWHPETSCRQIEAQWVHDPLRPSLVARLPIAGIQNQVNRILGHGNNLPQHAPSSPLSSVPGSEPRASSSDATLSAVLYAPGRLRHVESERTGDFREQGVLLGVRFVVTLEG